MRSPAGVPLSTALAAWRETRAAVIADAIDGLTDAALAGWQAPAPRTNAAFHDAWLAAVADDVHRGWAITTLLDKLPGGDSDSKSDSLMKRLEKLAQFPDPRVSREIAKQLQLSPPILGFEDVHNMCSDILVAFSDERLRTQLDEMRDTADSILEEVIERVRDADPPARAPSPSELAQYAAQRPEKPKAADTAALFREVYAHPDSNDARTVLADVLQAHGDPRGEFIALQLANDVTGRSDELLKKHGKDWLGDLRKITYRARFQRGFVTRLELEGKWNATKAGWVTHAADPALGTVEDLLVGRATSEVYKQLVTSPAMIGLKRIDVWDKHSLEALQKTSAKLEHVGCGFYKRGKIHDVFAKQLLPACERIPTIKSLGFDIEVFDVVKKSALFARLQRFVLPDFEQWLAIRDKLPKHAAIDIWRWARLEECLVQRTDWTGTATIEDGVLETWGAWLVNDLLTAIPDLPKLKLVVNGASADQDKALRAAAKRKKLSIEIREASRRTGYLSGLSK